MDTTFTKRLLVPWRRELWFLPQTVPFSSLGHLENGDPSFFLAGQLSLWCVPVQSQQRAHPFTPCRSSALAVGVRSLNLLVEF